MNPSTSSTRISRDRTDAARATRTRRSPTRARRASIPAALWSSVSDGPTSTIARCGRRTTTTCRRLSTLPSFRDLAGDRTYRFAREVIRLGNKAVHDASPPSRYDSVAAVSALFQFCYWFARTYSRHHKPAPGLTFDPKSLPDPRAAQGVEPRGGRLHHASSWRRRSNSRTPSLANACSVGRSSTRNWWRCARRSPGPVARPRRLLTNMTTRRSRPANSSSTCFSEKPDGISATTATVSSRCRVCRPSRASASSTTSYGVMMANPSRSSRPSVRTEIRSVGQQQAVLYADCLDQQQFRQRPLDLLHERLLPLVLGRHALPAAPGARLL